MFRFFSALMGWILKSFLFVGGGMFGIVGVQTERKAFT
jgi:hypothetical protein